MSRVVDDFFGGIDYAEIFTLFEQAVPFAQIVIATRLPPMVVREIYADYRAGLEPDRAPPVVRDDDRAPAPVKKKR